MTQRNLCFAKRCGDLIELSIQPLVEGVEHAVIERDRDALIANVGQQRDRIEQIVVREAVGVVGEEHLPHAAELSTNCGGRTVGDSVGPAHLKISSSPLSMRRATSACICSALHSGNWCGA